MRSRGIRRHHEGRVKSRVKSYYDGHAAGNPRSVGRIAHTRRMCSCRLCGNPRKYFRQATIQEMRAEQAGEA